MGTPDRPAWCSKYQKCSLECRPLSSAPACAESGFDLQSGDYEVGSSYRYPIVLSEYHTITRRGRNCPPLSQRKVCSAGPQPHAASFRTIFAQTTIARYPNSCLVDWDPLALTWMDSPRWFSSNSYLTSLLLPWCAARVHGRLRVDMRTRTAVAPDHGRPVPGRLLRRAPVESREHSQVRC
jgi:hypothetical protein